MVLKRIAIIFLIILTAVLAGYSPNAAATAAADLPPSVFLNDTPGTLVVTKPNPINLPTFILGGQWADKPFELYAFSGDGTTAGVYLGSDGTWRPYTGPEQIKPAIATDMAGYEGVNLPSFINLSWTALENTSQVADGEFQLTVCIDGNVDGTLKMADAECGNVNIIIKTPACILSLSGKTIQQTITQGGNALPMSITVSDSCNSTSFTASVVEGGGWISVPQSVNGSFDVSFNASSLQAQSQPYTATIQVTSAGGATDYITVSLTVNPTQACSTLTANPASVAFTGTITPNFNTVIVNNSPQEVTIKDCSGNTVANVTPSVDNGSKTWLSATPNVDGTLTVSANGSAGSGTHNGTITVSATGYTSLSVPVKITVTGGITCDSSIVSMFPSPVPFNDAAGGVSSQLVTVKDGCNNNKSFSSATASKNWMRVSPASGTGSFTVTVTMPATQDTGTITVTVDGKQYTVQVSAVPSGPACNLPASPSITDPGTTVASGAGYTVSWAAVAGATGYNICEATNSGFTGQTCSNTSATSANYNHTNSLCGAVTYYYKVRAVNSCGSGSYSTATADMQVPGTGVSSTVQLKDASGNVISLINKTMDVSLTYSQIMTVGDDCGTSISAFTATAYAALADGLCTTNPADPWISATKTTDSKLSVALNTGNLTAGVYKACVKLNFTGTSLPTLTLPVTLTVSAPLQQGVTPLTNQQITPIKSIATHTSQIYSAQQTGSYAGYDLATKDWATYQNMLVMYSGPTCGAKLPDINDYNDIIADVGRYSPRDGKIFNGYRFYYTLVGQNQAITLNNQPLGCYYVYIYNTSEKTGKYVLTWTQN